MLARVNGLVWLAGATAMSLSLSHPARGGGGAGGRRRGGRRSGDRRKEVLYLLRLSWERELQKRLSRLQRSETASSIRRVHHRRAPGVQIRRPAVCHHACAGRFVERSRDAG